MLEIVARHPRLFRSTSYLPKSRVYSMQKPEHNGALTILDSVVYVARLEGDCRGSTDCVPSFGKASRNWSPSAVIGLHVLLNLTMAIRNMELSLSE